MPRKKNQPQIPMIKYSGLLHIPLITNINPIERNHYYLSDLKKNNYILHKIFFSLCRGCNVVWPYIL